MVTCSSVQLGLTREDELNSLMASGRNDFLHYSFRKIGLYESAAEPAPEIIQYLWRGWEKLSIFASSFVS